MILGFYKLISLLYRKVDPNLFGKDNWTALEIAIQSGFFNIVDMLIKDKRTTLS